MNKSGVIKLYERTASGLIGPEAILSESPFIIDNLQVILWYNDNEKINANNNLI